MNFTRRISIMATRAALTVLIVLAACGGDDDPAGPIDTDVVGNWAFEVAGTGDSGTSCNVTGLTLIFARTGDTLAGTVSSGTTGVIACTPGGTGPFTGTGPLENVEQNGHNVEFTFEGTAGAWTMAGRVSANGNTMNGTVTFPVNFTSGVTEFTGTWSATRN